MPEDILKISFKDLDDEKVKEILAEHNIGLTIDEARQVEDEILKRPPTLAELVAFSIEGSEHCSYRSSKTHLKSLPTEAPNVILPVGEDSGIVEVARDGEERYGIIMSHESHNHPSQIVPYEGAATGIGGIVRDIACMGGKVIASADPLRFGDIERNESKWIHEGVVAGIAGYGNPIGVPNIAGDVYYNKSFNDNCLVNVVALGVIKESDIIHSRVPKEAGKKEYDLILVGKPTDNSGYGGASFASFELDEAENEKNKGAVQEPNAFLKRHLLESTYDLFKTLKEKKLMHKIGFKDLGGGGLLCGSVEICDAGGCGAEVDLDKVHVSIDGLPSHVVLTAETQERFIWASAPDVTELILNHYNEKWDLPKVSVGASARVIGKVKPGGYQVTSKAKKIIDSTPKDITAGLTYDRKFKEPQKELQEPNLKPAKDLSKELLKVLAHENIACRLPVYENYDKNVQAQVHIESGEADAGVILPFLEPEFPDSIRKTGVALAVDGNPFYGRISPYWQAVNAVVESMRNVAAVGAVPQALSDCLNYGNPEKPAQMWEFVEGVRGIKEAATNIKLKDYPEEPTPIVTGNVSFYNESRQGGAIDPCAVIGCVGRIDDYKKTVKQYFTSPQNEIYLVGERKDELGGSVYYDLQNELGANVPQPDFGQVAKQVYAITDAIDKGFIKSCHDISDGGLATTLSEMCFGNPNQTERDIAKNILGLEVDLQKIGDIETVKKLFSETGGFIFEVDAGKAEKVKQIFRGYGLDIYKLGVILEKPKFVISDNGKKVVKLEVSEMFELWFNGLRDKLK